MGAEEPIRELAEEKKSLAAGNETKKDKCSPRSYRLVVIMLSILGGLVICLLILPFLKESDKLYEYNKWALSVLLGD